MTQGPALKYIVLSNNEAPFLLARVRFPDIAQAISPSCHDWLEDLGLFDLPYDPAAITVSPARAAEIADDWGAALPAEDVVGEVSRPFIRWMPASWSELTPAERRAWSLTRLPMRPGGPSAGPETYRRGLSQLLRRGLGGRGAPRRSSVPVPNAVSLAAATDVNGGANR
jgi:hypothetical protein